MLLTFVELLRNLVGILRRNVYFLTLISFYDVTYVMYTLWSYMTVFNFWHQQFSVTFHILHIVCMMFYEGTFVFLVYVVFCFLVFDCQYQCNQLPGKTRL